ncbi:hypothetical protein GOP47_0020879 [Adiantum capillus-veneris]|uniref:Uncharacterized protein n=1 Tax=Adiantum capillus-veneris TaxID=13818 RepID=A0A9D4Z7D7_ADICA|nr:hypothetical protein GOP47_0020879 [Adiantum capillus-veneris]
MKGKRPATSEDTVFFSLFTRAGGEDNIEEKLHSLRTDCLAVAVSLCEGYIWQHQTFDLSLHVNNFSDASQSSAASCCPCASPPELEFVDDHAEGEHHAMASTPLPPHLHGKLKYGDNIEDEWFVVFLLFAVSRRFPDICIRVWDSDGEFLLIEAAYSIPSWLKPENSWNRVFIKNGEIHILPLPSSPAELFQLPLLPSIQDALRALYHGSFKTKADDSVQAAVMQKMSGFQQNPTRNMHNVVCRVPLPIAQILKHEPQLVALAVGAFYDRDLDSMKAASRMSHFLPSGQEPPLVDVMVRMSRAMYAQLKQQVFQAPRCYPMPNLSDSHYAEAEIGMKLTCGFEMMYWDRSDHGAQGKLSVTNTRGSKDVGWQAFLGSLKQIGYFRDLLEGSKEYRELMEHAVFAYQKTSLAARVSAAMNAPIQRTMEVLALPHSVNDFLSSEDLKSDDDSWLYDGEDELTNALLERQKELDMYERERGLRKKNQSQKLPRKLPKEKRIKGNFSGDEVVKNMRAFIDKMSSYEGAELPADKDDEGPITLRMETFLKELKSAFGSELETCPLNKTNSSLDEMKTSSSDSDSDIEDIEGRDPMDDDLQSTSPEEGKFMEEYAEALSRELTSSSLVKSFVPVEETASSFDKNKGIVEEMEGLPPVNIDVNLLQNILASYSSQHGLPGPASNLLGAMGLSLPDNKDDK